MLPLKFRSLALCCGILLASASVLAPRPGIAQAAQPGTIDQQALRGDMQRMIEQRRRQLLPEYQRRVRADGKASADAWLRDAAERLGRQDGQQVRRNHDRGGYDAAPRSRAVENAAAATTKGRADAGRRTDVRTRDGKRNGRACARMVTRQRSVPSVSGGPMQMIMVTECVSGPR